MRRPTLKLGLLAASMLGAWAVVPAQAQVLNQYFQNGVPGFDDTLGVTVKTRQRPDYDFVPYHVGNFEVSPSVSESLGYNDNLFGTSHGVGSFFNDTRGSITADSEYSRGGVVASAAVDDTRYWSRPDQNETNGAVSLGGSYDIGRNRASLGYTFTVTHENPGDIAATGGFSTPITIYTNHILADYAINLNRVIITPEVEFFTYRYDNSKLGGVPVPETYRNRDVVQGSLIGRYEIAPQESLIVVGRAANTHYVSPIPGFLTPDNNGYSILAGVDFTPSSLISYRALIGYQIRSYNGNQVPNHDAVVAEANASYTPTGLTTFSASFSRTIEDAAEADIVGYTYTRARLQVDHELYRNILLNGTVGYQRADYLSTGGSQNVYDIGGGVSYLLNRYARVTATYNFSTSDSSGVTAVNTFDGTSSSHYIRNIALLQLQLGAF